MKKCKDCSCQKETVKFYNVGRDVKLPERGTPQSAGIDFFIPNDWNGGAKYILPPNEGVKIPTGFMYKLPEQTALIMFNKSGVATKQLLIVGACVGDEDYQGEFHIHVINVSGYNQELIPGNKLAQGVLIPVIYADVIEVTDKAQIVGVQPTQRGDGGFGSTGN